MSESRDLVGEYLPPGTLVRYDGLSPEEDGPELGIVVHCWIDKEIDGYDCYVAFFGEAVPRGKPAEKPYVLRYSSASLTVLEPPMARAEVTPRQLSSIYEQEFPELFAFILENKLDIFYDPSRRRFSIGGTYSSATQAIRFCPWTGKRLPVPLAEIFGAMLESRGLSIFEPETWPPAWRDETWWIEAGEK